MVEVLYMKHAAAIVLLMQLECEFAILLPKLYYWPIVHIYPISWRFHTDYQCIMHVMDVFVVVMLYESLQSVKNI